MNNRNVKILSPFVLCCQKVIPLAFDESMSYYECLCGLYNYIMNNLTPAINENADAVTELQNKFIELKSYIDNYFTNLDVQEEINNKLDEMAESGQLSDIIAQYINLKGVLGFNNKQELKNATNIVNGSIARTLGTDTYNDGLGDFWKIRKIVNTDVVDDINLLQIIYDNTLVAEKIINPTITSLLNDVDELKEDVQEINTKLENNKNQQLSDTVQARIYKELTGLFDYSIGWSLSSCIIVGNRGIAVANDWTENGSGGTKFNIVTFIYENETISNITLRHQLVDGHSNSMCQLDNDNVLIAGLDHSYIYNLTSNTYTETTVLNDMGACSNYGEDIYICSPANNKLCKVLFNNNTLTIEEEYTINGLYESLNNGSQGMVIYDNKIFFMGYAPVCLVIYDLNNKKLIKNQLFTSPYICEFEDGFVYNNEILLCDTKGRLFKVDIYGKHNIGGYYNDVITKSLTDILLFNTPTRIEFNQDNTFTFEDIMTFLNSNSNSDIGTLGSQLESLTIYLGYGSASSEVCNQLTPVEVLCYKTLHNANLKNKDDGNTIWFERRFNASYMNEWNGTIEKYSVFGNINYAGGDTVPSIKITPNKYVTYQTLNNNQTQLIDATQVNVNLYLLKIVGHRKVGEGY